MSALKRDPLKVKSKSINVRISIEEQLALQEWNQRAKLSPTTNDRISISKLVRQSILTAITTK
jgi:hypothetical protein